MFIFNSRPPNKGHEKQVFPRIESHKVLPQSAIMQPLSHLTFLMFSFHCQLDALGLLLSLKASAKVFLIPLKRVG